MYYVHTLHHLSNHTTTRMCSFGTEIGSGTKVATFFVVVFKTLKTDHYSNTMTLGWMSEIDGQEIYSDQ